MFEEKESFWKKKGFYISACALLIAIMAVGVVYYRQTTPDSENDLLANIATEMPEVTKTPVITDKPLDETVQTNANISKNVLNKNSETESAEKEQKTKDALENKKVTQKKEERERTEASDKKREEAVTASTSLVKHSFNEEKGLLWPVKGDVVLKYSMSNTIYFKTLAQYKCNPGIVISAKEGTNVKAAADCTVTKVEKDEELGTVVTTDIGNSYTVLYGQLDNISVNKGDVLKEGDVLGTVAAPTKYFTEEGSNLYFQVKQGKETIDPLLLLR